MGHWKINFYAFNKKIIDTKLYENGNKKYISFNINPWEYDDERNFVAVFLAKLYEETKEELIKDESQAIINLFKGLITPLKVSYKTVVNVEYDFSKLNFNEQKKEIDRLVSEKFMLSKTIANILDNPVFDETKIIVFVDDLDRCGIDKVMEVIESIKLILNSKNCIFFIGCDRNYLEKAISVRYEKFLMSGSKSNKNSIVKSFASDYLEKIIQVPFYIPALDESSINNYISCILDGHADTEVNQVLDDLDLFEEFKHKLNKNLIMKLVTSIGVNPRKVRRILNLLFLSYLFIRFKIEENAVNEIDLDILSILNIIRDYDHDYYNQYLSDESLCTEIFESYYNKNQKRKDPDNIEGEIPAFMQNDMINDCFTSFYKNLNISNSKELKKKLKHVKIYISVSNIITSEKSGLSVNEYRSDTATNRNIGDFMRKLEKNDQAKKFVTWFFTHIYDKDKFALGINENIHLYKKNTDGEFDVLKNFIFRIEFDLYSNVLNIKFERGKYQCFISNYEEILKNLERFDNTRKLISISTKDKDEDIISIQKHIKELLEKSYLFNNNIKEVAADGENKN